MYRGVEIMFNKDIKLKPSSYGQYDREFYVNDFKTVEGLESVENSIIISLMTRLGELNHNPTYNNFGCGIYAHLKQNYTPLTKITIQEQITKSLEKIKGITNVEHVQIQSNPNNPHILDVYFTITLNNNTKISNKIELGGI